MYKLYTDKCHEEAKTPARIHTYRNIFNREFNLFFHVPKKDLCDFCTQYRNTSRKSQELEMRFRTHCQQKALARKAKELSKTKAKANSNFMSACFDLEKVLACPHGDISSFYYHRKLALYNLTAYSLGTTEAHCYLWTEVIARRGANEVASCLYYFVKFYQSKGVTVFEFFSDNCTGQNRNRTIATLWWYIMQNSQLERIRHSFLEVGHTQNENDAVLWDDATHNN